MVGTLTLAGRYRLDQRLAGGGMGTVYVATDELLGRRVAVKLLNEDLVDNPSFVERFRREARAVAGLVHPNIATVFDYGEDDGRRFIVMELVEGVDLEHLLRAEGRLHPQRAKEIAIQVCEALGHAHGAGVVHRDVKPANVIVGPEDHVKVTDFGIARAVGDATMTAAGSVLGTAHYMSPEQASDGAIGPPSDVYSMGIVLFQMLTGGLPFEGGSPVAVAMRHLNEDVPAPSSVDPKVPPELDRVVTKATAKDPRQRFADGADMARALAEGADATAAMAAAPKTAVLRPVGRSTDPLQATEWPPPRRARRRAPRRTPRRLGPALAVILLILALAAGVVVAYALLRDQEEPRRAGGGGRAERRAEPAPTTPPEEQLVVPSGLVGSNVGIAEAVLRGAGLNSRRVFVENETEEGTVIATDPQEGEPVSEGETVTLTVSTGPAQQETPPAEVQPEEDGTPQQDESPGQQESPGRGPDGKPDRGKKDGD